ncbi:hypothetical protein G3545_27295 [Starkeya sp. ORNL1]|uniref:hypothetical protein n=1 Tax=Starkeya sp. ORNL1 TaxID=2709380 RepID=UPI001462FC12|nr:hypothetical protein [Starkeya sp. ORNL1]QJP17026.1 hypothetical protein G3545_27295 [Starkeya sp. ORNL1]
MNINAKLPEKPHTSRRIVVTVGIERIEIRSLRSAVELLRSLRADICGEQAARLCAQMQEARSPADVDAAWLAFCRWAGACGLTGGDDGHHPVKRAA